ncbi:hypothetical protein [Chryseobacterium terrae]|uniref:Cytochrome c domain-containing protein n=1 Tax=Chryseobacterium terrae TaxID=3163299 RepID=A0ABW8Y2A1_9FLAO
MKKILLLILFILFNCKDSNQNFNNLKPSKKPQPTKIKYGKKFFDYNKLDHYHIDREDDSVLDLYENQNKSTLDKFKYEVITGETPNTINDLKFLKFIEKIGYSKKYIDPSNFEILDKIFVEKPEENMTVASCIPIFRDILIFKKNEKVTGMMKICFSCHQYSIFGTKAETKFFGSDNDYEQLWKILSEK